MPDVDSGESCGCGGARSIEELSVLAAQVCCEPLSAPKKPSQDSFIVYLAGNKLFSLIEQILIEYHF